MNAADAIQNVTLPAGKRLTVTMAASSTALVQRYQGDVFLDQKALAASQVWTFGEYAIDVSLRISCLTGSLSYAATGNTGNARIPATQTNDDAAAGEIGEFKTAQVLVGAAVSLTTATAATVTSLALTPGDWDVWGVVDYNLTGATTTHWDAGISATTNNIGAQDAHALQPVVLTTETDVYAKLTPRIRVSLAAAATIYLVGYAAFSAGSVGAFGTINARRVR